MTERDTPTALETTTELDTTLEQRAERIADSIRSQITDEEGSRRSFLAKSAVAGGALLALSGGTAVAQDEEEEEEEAEEEMTPFADRGTDVDVLNYALTLENLEDAFYREALEEYDEDDFVDSDALSDLEEEERSEIYEYVVVAGEHESTHVDVLTQVVELLGGDPAMELEYDFGFESVEDVLAIAQAVENLGVAAYAGAAPYIESPDLVSAAVSIHSVEARHAAVFNRVNGESPFPDAFDPAMSQQEVLDAAGEFIVGPADEDDDDEDDDLDDDDDDEDDDFDDDEDDDDDDEDDDLDDDEDDNGLDDDEDDNGLDDDDDNGIGDDNGNGANGNETNGNGTNGNGANGNETNGNGTNGNETDTGSD